MKLPKILVIQIKRFDANKYKKIKLNNKVIFPLRGLNLRKYFHVSIFSTEIILTKRI